jgi:hypothetical protein
MNEPQIRAQPYRQLSKVLRDMGYEKEARRVLIALEEERDRQSLQVWQKARRRFYRVGFRYGYDPVKPAVVVALVGFLIGWVVVSLGKSAGLMISARSRTLASASAGQLSPMLYSLDVLLPIHAFHQEEEWWPRAEGWRWCFCWPGDLPWGHLLRWWICIEMVLGWTAIGLIVAGLAGVVRRE